MDIQNLLRLLAVRSPMASSDQVRRYLSYWFQLGKPVILKNGDRALLPQPVIQGDRYSPQFEDCWQQILAANTNTCYLEGSDQTLAELLSSEWEIAPCARCEMPVPMLNLGAREPSCPCVDLPFWPNTDLPQPRSPVDSRTQLNQIRDRLSRSSRSSED